ncbi:MAG: hypothetical protein NVS3B10_01120 [Polyangiales bacterium]
MQSNPHATPGRNPFTTIVLLASVACAGACSGGATASDLGPPSKAAPGQPSSGDAGSAPTGAATTTPTAPAPTASPTSTSCTGKSPQPLDATWTLDLGGDARTFDVHVPASYDPAKPTPGVFNFHGYTSDASQETLLAHLTDKADQVGFVAIHPQGINNSWNAGACCGDASAKGLEDVAFVSKMLDQLEAKLCVDTRRVFATGMSNGGFLSHRLACELADRIAAVAPVAGVLGVQECKPTRPVPVMHFHGTSDPLVPYDGSDKLGFPAVQATFEAWAKREGCTGAPAETFRNVDSHCSTYAACAHGSEVTLCTVDGGGHTWPGGTPVPALGYTTPWLSATDRRWSFFASHPMP